MAKKVFYNRRHKLPPWAQLYAVWGVVTFVALGILFFTSVERVPPEEAAAMPTAVNGFADGLFYEMRDSDAESQPTIVREYAAKLEKKYGFRLREGSLAACKILRLSRGKAQPYGIAAVLEGERSQSAFALLTFLDRAATAYADLSADAMLIFAGKGCEPRQAMQQFAPDNIQLPVFLADGDNSYQRIFHLRNLKLRRHFAPAFLSREHTLWADILAMLGGEHADFLSLPVKFSWAENPEATLKQNPLLHHPAFSRVAALDAENTALYIGQNTQLHKGGFIALLVIITLLACIPFFNALGTFKERLDLGSALTSSVLYGAAFLASFGIMRLVLHLTRSDLLVIGLSLVAIPAVYIPVRILQKSVLRAELNRAGLHLLLQSALIGAIFVNPLVAMIGLIALALLSGFSRATIGRRLLRVAILSLVITLFVLAARGPLGGFANYFGALLPALSFSQALPIALLCFITGNLMALVFVPRERV